MLMEIVVDCLDEIHAVLETVDGDEAIVARGMLSELGESLRRSGIYDPKEETFSFEKNRIGRVLDRPLSATTTNRTNLKVFA